MCKIKSIIAEEAPRCKSDTLGCRAAVCRLDEAAFPAFATFLAASQDYARLTGYRFSLDAFEGIECCEAAISIISKERGQDTGALLGAKLYAAPDVKSTAEKLRAGDSKLEENLARAFEIVVNESTRNSMIATCKELELFPPSIAPADVGDFDCSWSDLSAPLASIAQRLYNDEAQRLCDVVDGENPTQRRAKTASYIVEFAEEVGIEVPHTTEDQLEMLRDFDKKVERFRKASEMVEMGRRLHGWY